MAASDALLPRLLLVGDEKQATAWLKNKKTVAAIDEAITEAKVTSKVDGNVGTLLVKVATTLPLETSDVVRKHRVDLLGYITSGKIRTDKQLNEAIKYMKKTYEYDAATLEKEAGVGIVISEEEIKSSVQKYVEDNKERLVADRYSIVGECLNELTNQVLKWADGRLVKQELDRLVLELLGPKTEADAKQKKKGRESSTAAPAATGKKGAAAAKVEEETKTVTLDNLPDDFLEGRAIPWARNTPEQLKKHLEATGGKIVTRFPPEPNGFLHLGHAKAMNFNFGLAKKKGGNCIMRFDDTNPEAEKKVYIDSILENVAWLGHKQSETTYSSDHFEKLHELAIKLIKKGSAYVCHQTAEEMKQYREEKKDSPYRNRTVEENLKLFEDMRKGKFEEGKAVLRMKGDMKHPNPQFWDVVAYRIKYTPHPHVGEKWCIYPTYDYTHCIIDSLENITHSCCTLEFEIRRESYYWLLHELDLYKPKVWEYSRLNLEYNVLSKRRLLRLVNEKHVNGWDDPRLLTLNGLRRKGYTAEAINLFCDRIGVSRNDTMIPDYVLEKAVRDCLDPTARRTMIVTDPIKVVITNYPEGKVEQRTVADHPKDEQMGTHTVAFSRVVYIESSDFRADGAKDKSYYGLAPGKEVHLKYAYNIKCTDFKTEDGKPVIYATYDEKNTNKPQGKIHWVAEPAPGKKPLEVELRLYSRLFKSKDPMSVEGNWLEDLNPDSLKVVRGYADAYLASAAKPGDRFQFERVGYFNTDDDSTSEALIFNRTCLLNESKEKPKEKGGPKKA